MLLTITLNTSIDKAYFLNSSPKIDEVNRVDKVVNSAGGKGLNVSRAIKACNCDILATGFIGGHNGHYLQDLLNQDKIQHDFVEVSSETRSCINILGNKGSTEFLEPGPFLTNQELQKFTAKFTELINKCDCAIISGSIPQGIPHDYYSQLIDIAKGNSTNVYLDTSGKALCSGIEAKPHFIKPNKQEAEELCGVKIDSVQDATDAAKTLVSKGIDIVAISLGSQGAVVANNKEAYHSCINSNLEIKNTVGCGDTFVGAFAISDSNNKCLKDCLEFALAASKSNALSEKTGYCNLDEIDELIKLCETKKL